MDLDTIKQIVKETLTLNAFHLRGIVIDEGGTSWGDPEGTQRGGRVVACVGLGPRFHNARSTLYRLKRAMNNRGIELSWANSVRILDDDPPQYVDGVGPGPRELIRLIIDLRAELSARLQPWHLDLLQDRTLYFLSEDYHDKLMTVNITDNEHLIELDECFCALYGLNYDLLDQLTPWEFAVYNLSADPFLKGFVLNFWPLESSDFVE